jgi:VWFA-related protein
LKLRVTAALAAFALVLAGQTTIRSTVPLVVVPVTVMDRSGHFVEGLQASDFSVVDEGHTRDVRVDIAGGGLAPVALVVLVQTSDLSTSALGKVRKMGGVISEAVMGGNAEGALISYDDSVRVLQDFTPDGYTLGSVFKSIRATDTGRARELDAVERALKLLTERPGARRANILIIGQSRDRGSETKLQTVMDDVQRQGVTIYTLSYSAYLTPFTVKASEYVPPPGGPIDGIIDLVRLAKTNTAAALTRISGGRQFGFETKSRLEKELLALGAEIHQRYLLTFTPELSSQPSFHKLTVSVKDREDLQVRTRPGYWAGLQ